MLKPIVLALAATFVLSVALPANAGIWRTASIRR